MQRWHQPGLQGSIPVPRVLINTAPCCLSAFETIGVVKSEVVCETKNGRECWK
jgi:hypothetical protein